jgi:hypothetical protein
MSHLPLPEILHTADPAACCAPVDQTLMK